MQVLSISAPAHSRYPVKQLTEQGNKLLNGAFPNYNVKGSNKANTIPELILAALQANSPARIGKQIPDTCKPNLIQRILKAVKEGIPVPMHTLYGTAKYTLGDKPQANVVDLLDYGALCMIQALNKNVQEHYKPGIEVKIYLEDVGGYWLFGNNEPIKLSQETYIQSLNQLQENLLSQFGFSSFSFVRESDCLKNLGLTMEDFYRKSEQNTILFRNYWGNSGEIISKKLSEEGYESWSAMAGSKGKDAIGKIWDEICGELSLLDSYKELNRAGWQGYIHPEMRDFYIKRYQNNAPHVGLTLKAIEDYMHRYFAGTLAKKQFESCTVGMPKYALKLTLLSYAPQVPEQFKNQIAVRSLPNNPKLGFPDTCVAPWRGEGGFLFESNEKEIQYLRFRGEPVMNQTAGERIEANIHIGNAQIKSDFIAREPEASTNILFDLKPNLTSATSSKKNNNS